MAQQSGMGMQLLSVSVASGDALDVRQFSVDERISSLFAISLSAVSKNEDLDFDAVVGQPASFTVRHARGERTWRGLVSHLQHSGVSGESDGLSTYDLVIVPTLWLATQRKNHRMFQQISEPDIVLKMLSEDWDIEADVRLTSRYKKRKYRVQYAESDYAFMLRMLEDSGISFYFEDKGGETKLVLSDAPHLFEPRPPLPFRDNPAETGAPFVTEVRVAQQVRPGKYTMRDHDYRLSPKYNLAKTALMHDVPIEEKLERFQYTPGAFLFEADRGEDTPLADDRGKTRTDEREGELLAKKRLEAKRSAAKVLSFDTSAHDLAPGVVMSMMDHSRTDLAPDRRWLVIASRFGGTPAGDWTHTCEAASAAIPFRPPLVTPKPKVIGVESATVVGPPGEEIHTDEFGRVRVHFHWDRESNMDDKSSCWIHVSQPWAGGGFGGTNLPRVGQEVLVDFLGGDPDRPVIVGRLYTNLQKTPYKLPGSKTQSGWKSESSPGGGGSNEFRFEDAKGREHVYMQAEKDLQKLVKHNEDVTIGHNRTKTVKGNDTHTVVHNRTHTVLQSERVAVGHNQKVTIGINRVTEVGAIDSTTVGDTHSVTVSPPGEGFGTPSTSIVMKFGKIVLSTGLGATITLQGKKITFSADMITLKGKKNTFIRGKKGVHVASSNGDIDIKAKTKMALKVGSGDLKLDGGPMVKINNPGLFSARVTDPAPATILRGSSTVFVGGPTFPFDVEQMPNGDLKVGTHIYIPNEPGRPQFQSEMLDRLSRISQTQSGMTMLNTLQNNAGGHDTFFYYFHGSGGSEAWPSDKVAATPAGMPVFNADGTPVLNPDKTQVMGTGLGSDAHIGIDPDFQLPNDDHPEPNEGTVFHELTHGSHYVIGTRDDTPLPGTGWTNNEEFNTISNGTPSENDYLKEIGYGWVRTDHDEGWVPAGH